MPRVLSIDLPWGAANVMGAALAEIEEGIARNVLVHAVNLQVDPPVGPLDDEAVSFIETGAGVGAGLRAGGDGLGQFARGFPCDQGSRAIYLNRIAAGLTQLAHDMPLAREVSLAMIDVPLVPAAVAQAEDLREHRQSRFRPLERAFQGKSRVPLEGARNRPNFAIFNAGIIRGCRPGYAIASLVTAMFQAQHVLETFPQLVVGALGEMANAQGMPMPLGLTGHKRPPYDGQERIMGLISHFLGVQPQWVSPDLGENIRADGVDALLGLLPGVAKMRPVPPGREVVPYASPVKLLNLPHVPELGLPERPPSVEGVFHSHAINCRHWIVPHPALRPGIDDSGVLVLDLGVWQ